MEAAFLLPLVMFLLALLVQPVSLLYTRMVMASAAGEAARVMATAPDEQTARLFALRRLQAIPPVSLFHVGGEEDWKVNAWMYADERTVQVEIRGHARPLPFFGDLVAWAFERDDVGVVLHVEIAEKVRPEWLEGGYDDWMAQW